MTATTTNTTTTVSHTDSDEGGDRRHPRAAPDRPPGRCRDWGRRHPPRRHRDLPGEIVRTGASRAIATGRGANAYARRTTDGGKTWSPPRSWTSQYGIRGLGRRRRAPGSTSHTPSATRTSGRVAHRLYYRRSADGGVTWGRGPVPSARAPRRSATRRSPIARTGR